MVGPTRLNIVLNDRPEEVVGLSASSEVFAALGVAPEMGRAFSADEDLEGNDGVIVISHEFWQTRLGGRPDVLGLTLTTNTRPRSIVGVMPPAFTIEGQRADFLVPYGWTMERLRAAPGRGSSHAVARLRDGVSVQQATDEMKTIAAQLEAEVPQRNTGWSVSVVPIHELTVEQIRTPLLILAGAVGLVLLIACVNVANLLLARSTARQRELGLRTALGAERGRLLRMMLTESLLLAAAGGLAGLALAVVFHRGLLVLAAGRIPVPRLDQVSLDLPVVFFTLALALGTGLIFGLVPALFAANHANDQLRAGGRHGAGPASRRALDTLVVAEVALSLVLLAGAGLLIRSFVALQQVNPGFVADGVLTARVQVSGDQYSEPRRIATFYTDVLSRVAVQPGVQSAAGVTFLPMSGPGIGTSFHRLDQPTPDAGEAPTTEVRPVTPGFFKTMGIPQLSGRDFSDGDAGDAPLVAVVSDTLARQQFPGENPLGRRMNVSIGRPGGMDVEIVGVVGDIKMSHARRRHPPGGLHAALATDAGADDARRQDRDGSDCRSSAACGRPSAASIRRCRWPTCGTMSDVVDATLARPRAISVLLTAFAVMALALAGIGVYGVMAYAVSQRTQEFGVRMALGASAESVFRLVLGKALTLVSAGVVVGLIAAAGLTRLLTTLLFETEPLDPWTFGATAVVLLLVATLASWVPARRGTRVAPIEALRAE